MMIDTRHFTAFERDLVAAIIGLYPEFGNDLSKCMETARVVKRDNTGHGFFTDFEVAPTSPKIIWPHIIYGPDAGVAAREYRTVMGFILWLKDDLPHSLEGFQYGTEADGTINLKKFDLSELVWINEGE